MLRLQYAANNCQHYYSKLNTRNEARVAKNCGLPSDRRTVTMPLLIKRHPVRIVILLLIVAALGAWFYWNRPTHADLSAWAPADSLAFVEANDLKGIAGNIEDARGWQAFAPLLGSPSLSSQASLPRVMLEGFPATVFHDVRRSATMPAPGSRGPRRRGRPRAR